MTTSIQSDIAAISSEEWLMLAREVEHRAVWQPSEHNADKLFDIASMFRARAQQRQTLFRPKRARRDSEIRVWRSWEVAK